MAAELLAKITSAHPQLPKLHGIICHQVGHMTHLVDEDRYTDLRFISYGNAFLADAILVQRYVEIAGQLKRVISAVKVRGSAHSKDIRFFDIADEKIIIGEPLTHYQGILSGQPTSTLQPNQA